MKRSPKGSGFPCPPGSGRGFTIPEVLVTFLILGFAVSAIFFVYRHSVNSFKATTWKQERTRQAEAFWNILRKFLEEATDELVKNGSGPTWTLDKNPKPLKYAPLTPGNQNKNLLAWEVHHVDSMGDPDYQQKHILKLEDGRLFLASVGGGGKFSHNGHPLVEDVSQFVVSSTNIRLSPGTGPDDRNREYLETTPSSDPVVGSVVEISFTLAPPPDFPLQNLRIGQSAKFKLAVGAITDSNPSY